MQLNKIPNNLYKILRKFREIFGYNQKKNWHNLKKMQVKLRKKIKVKFRENLDKTQKRFRDTNERKFRYNLQMY